MNQDEKSTVGDLIRELNEGKVTREQVAEAIRPLMEEPGRVIQWDAEVRTGPRMRELRDYVSAVPGCSKAAALRGVGLPTRGRGAYRPIDRALAAGLLVAERTRRGYLLFATEADRVIFELKNELLRGQPTPERAEEIVAHLARLRAGKAQTWVG